jgi:Mor family transcriptional regulator
MNQNVWTHTNTKAEYGITGAMGTPRAWLRRALAAQTLDDTTFQPGTLTPGEISIGGIWYRPCSVPITGMHRELFRFFKIPDPENIANPRKQQLVPVIGMCAAVPMHEIMNWLKIYKEHNAIFTWWNTPIDANMRAQDPSAGKRIRRQLDHAVVYKMLDAGKNRTEIARLLDFPPENIDYVAKKWKANTPLYEKFAKPRIDAIALIRDYKAGASAIQLADQYNTSQAYVYKLIRNNKCQDQNQL